MERFYLHIKDGDDVFLDDEGVELPSVDVATSAPDFFKSGQVSRRSVPCVRPPPSKDQAAPLDRHGT